MVVVSHEARDEICMEVGMRGVRGGGWEEGGGMKARAHARPPHPPHTPAAKSRWGRADSSQCWFRWARRHLSFCGEREWR